jgi:competence protein ComEC
MKLVLRLLIIFILFPFIFQFSLTSAEPNPTLMTIAFIDVGQGDATLIRDGVGFDVLIDGGQKSAGELVLAYLRQVGVDDLEVVVATHADRDHIGGLIRIIEGDEFPIESVFYNGYPGDSQTWMEFEAAINAEGLSLTPAHYPFTFTWGGITAQVLNPLPNLIEPEQNEASIVLMIDYAQIATLLPADIDAEVEALLPGRTSKLQAEILKVAHHGSKYSTSQTFLQEVQPQEAIISVGLNPYGHPAPETLKRLKNIGTQIWRTDFAGTVLLTTDGESYHMLPHLSYLPLSFLFPPIP